MIPFAYKNLRQAIVDLERNGHLLRIKEEVDPYLQMAAIHRRVRQVNGPALYFERIKGCLFPAVSNLFGTSDRSRFLLRHGLRHAEGLLAFKAEPARFLKSTKNIFRLASFVSRIIPRPALLNSVLSGQSAIEQLPQIYSSPQESSASISLAQIYTEDFEKRGLSKNNIEMCRVQILAKDNVKNNKIELQYSDHSEIARHYASAMRAKEDLYFSLFIGGPPAHTIAAMTSLPDIITKILFTGALSGRSFRYKRMGPYLISVDADFCLLGKLGKANKKIITDFSHSQHEDKFGYESMNKNTSLAKLEGIYHRKDAIWPFTVKESLCQDNAIWGDLIQQLIAPIFSASIPGLKAMRIVDTGSIYPLIFAIAAKISAPHKSAKDNFEVIRIANAILGSRATSLTKYLIITTAVHQHFEINQTSQFLSYILERVDWRRDLHFQNHNQNDERINNKGSSSSMDREDSRLIITVTGNPIRELGTQLSSSFKIPVNFKKPLVFQKGIILISGPRFSSYTKGVQDMDKLRKYLEKSQNLSQKFPLIVVVDDSHFEYDFGNGDLASNQPFLRYSLEIDLFD